MLNDFIAYLEEQVKNHSIYIWGAQGQAYPTVTEAWIKKKESGTNQTNALKVYRAAVAAGYQKLLRAFDCSGLGMYWLYNLTGLESSDKNAHGMKGKCVMIQKSHLKKGDWVFRVYKSGSKKGRAYHIGYVIDDDLNVIEARGRAYGVQKRALNASGTGYWNAFGRPSYFADEIDTTEEKAEHMSFNRLLKKGMRGDDVKRLQELLNAAGDNLETDGIFGSKTLDAVKLFQSRNGLVADGIVGEKTVAALAGAGSVLWSIDRLLKNGARGDDVRTVQNALKLKGFDVGRWGVDGVFGSGTERAVRAFQSAKGLEVDGIVGKDTVRALGGAWRA